MAILALEVDGFGPNPFFHCLVVDDPSPNEKRIIGYTLYYFTYSTWDGRNIYMADLYVTPDFRRQGIGKLLWKACVQVSLKPVNSGIVCHSTRSQTSSWVNMQGTRDKTKTTNLNASELP